MDRSTKNLWVGVAFATLVAAASPMAANAQGAGADSQLSISIPAQRLSDALRQLAEASHLQLIYDTKITDGKASPGVSGAMTSRAALAQLLAGSGLSFKFSGDRTVTIAAAATPGVRAVGVVNVEGVGADMPNGEMASPINGVNGSKDVEATEGTGSYTTGAMSIVSKTPQSIRETPQSVSVITQQRIADQGLLGIKDVLGAMPGITATTGPTGSEFNIYSRGFPVVSFSFDGGAPISYQFGNRPVLDISEYDSVQLIRGADGLFGGYGNPGGFVNLERKKPLDHNQFTYSQDIGSWNNFREEADATGPLSSDGKLKGRVALAEQDQDFFYKVANSHKSSIYGVLEYDLSPTTIFTVGGNYVRERNLPNVGGLPRYSDGTTINWPTSTCLCASFNYDDAARYEAFATINYKINQNISTKLNFTYNHQDVSAMYYVLNSTIKPGATPDTATATNGLAKATLSGYSTVNPNNSYALDYTVNGNFDIFGLKQTFVLGGNYIYYNFDGGSTTYPGVSYTIPDVFQFNPSLYPKPAYTNPQYITSLNRQHQYGFYGNVKLEVIKDLHVLLGMRYSGYQDEQRGVSYGTPFVTPSLKDTSHSTVDVGATYDFFKNFTIYAGHEGIYQPQSGTRYTTGGLIPPPITGINDEAGLKWQSPDKLFNASLSVFRILENGLESTNYQNPTSDIPVIENMKSRGLDIDMAGQLLPGLQVSANYSYNKTKDQTSYSSNPLTSYSPINKVKTFATYRPKGSGVWGRFIVGGGVDWQTSAFTLGYVLSSNVTNGLSTYSRVPLTTNGYATFRLKLGYRVNSNIELSLDVKNVTNEKEYSPLKFSSTTNYNYYIEPRSLMASLHAKW